MLIWTTCLVGSSPPRGLRRASSTLELVFAIAFVFVTSVARSADAQSSADLYVPPPRPAGVTIAADRPDVVFDLEFSDGRLIQRCRGSCGVWLPRGEYRLIVYATAETTGGERRLTVEDSCFVTIVSRTHSKRALGKALTIGGAVALGVGMTAFMVAEFAYGDVGDRTPSKTEEDLLIITLVGGVLGGATALSVGIPLWASSRPALRVAPRGTALSVQLAPATSGMGLSVVTAF